MNRKDILKQKIVTQTMSVPFDSISEVLWDLMVKKTFNTISMSSWATIWNSLPISGIDECVKNYMLKQKFKTQ